MSMDKFLLAENPMREGGALAIIHTQQPISIILVEEGHAPSKYPHNHYIYTNSDQLQELYTLSLYHCFATSFDGENNAVMTDKLFKQAWHWYMAYMAWEDQQIDANENEAN